MQNDSGSPLEPVALATSVCQVSEQPGRRIWCPGLELLPDSFDPYSLDPLIACDKGEIKMECCCCDDPIRHVWQ